MPRPLLITMGPLPEVLGTAGATPFLAGATPFSSGATPFSLEGVTAKRNQQAHGVYTI